MNYLYNGVELPDINTVWTDKTTYPYAVIQSSPFDIDGIEMFLMTISSVKSIYRTNYTPPAIVFDGPCATHLYTLACNQTTVDFLAEQLGIQVNIGEWTTVEFSEIEEGNAESFNASTAMWSSYDILKADGTIYLAASDPVPVGGSSTFTIDQASFLAGYKAGAELRRLRKAGGGYGINIPALPNYDETTYPYVAVGVYDTPLSYGGNKIVAGCAVANAPTYYDDSINNPKLGTKWEGPCTAKMLLYALFDGATGWTLADTFDEELDFGRSYIYWWDGLTFVYTNHSILKESDGSVYMAKSTNEPPFTV